MAKGFLTAPKMILVNFTSVIASSRGVCARGRERESLHAGEREKLSPPRGLDPAAQASEVRCAPAAQTRRGALERVGCWGDGNDQQQTGTSERGALVPWRRRRSPPPLPRQKRRGPHKYCGEGLGARARWGGAAQAAFRGLLPAATCVCLNVPAASIPPAPAAGRPPPARHATPRRPPRRDPRPPASQPTEPRRHPRGGGADGTLVRLAPSQRLADGAAPPRRRRAAGARAAPRRTAGAHMPPMPRRGGHRARGERAACWPRGRAAAGRGGLMIDPPFLSIRVAGSCLWLALQ